MHKLKHVNILQKFAGVCDFFIQLNIAKCVTRFHKSSKAKFSYTLP